MQPIKRAAARAAELEKLRRELLQRILATEARRRVDRPGQVIRPPHS